MDAHAVGTHFEHDLGNVGMRGLEGQKLQVCASLENAHDDVIRTSCKHAVVAERAGDSGWIACSPACLVYFHFSHHAYITHLCRKKNRSISSFVKLSGLNSPYLVGCRCAQPVPYAMWVVW